MSKKICRKCHEINSSNTMICSNCNSTLVDAEIIEDGQSITEGQEPLLGSSAASTNITYSGGSDVISIGMWIGIFIVTAIPLVNIIALCYMAFGNHPETINNYGRAALILGAIGLVLLLLVRGCGGGYYY